MSINFENKRETRQNHRIRVGESKIISINRRPICQILCILLRYDRCPKIFRPSLEQCKQYLRKKDENSKGSILDLISDAIEMNARYSFTEKGKADDGKLYRSEPLITALVALVWYGCDPSSRSPNRSQTTLTQSDKWASRSRFAKSEPTCARMKSVCARSDPSGILSTGFNLMSVPGGDVGLGFTHHNTCARVRRIPRC